MSVRLKGWRFGVFLGLFAGSVGSAFYFTAVRPMLNPNPYKQIRESVASKLPSKLE